MSTCSILNENTKEPEIFYKSTSGEEFSSLYDVLNNTSDSYEIGFKDVTETFISKATVPVFDKSTKEGQIQGYIRNGYLSGRQVAPNTFEATDNLAADILEQDLLINNYNEFRREGNNFTFDDFNIDISKFPEDQRIQSEIIQLHHELKGKKTKKEIRYTDSNLKNMIESFMQKVGFSTTTIENYKQNYKTKFGIEPSANVFIDLQNKIIAVANGEITLDELSEEFSHFVIEAWNQDEIKRMIQSVNNTKEYIEHAENYRQIYVKQVSDPIKLEEAVRREILGKMLANSLRKDFRLYDKTDTEITFFRKLSDILGNFIKFFKSKFNPSLQDDIDKMAQDIENRLYNDKLEESLDMNQTPILTIMYNADEKTHKKIIEALGNEKAYPSEVERDIDQVFNTAISGAIAANDAMKNLTDNEVISHELGATIENLIGMEEVIETGLAYYKNLDLSKGKTYTGNLSVDEIKAFQRQIVEKGNRTVAEISEMKGLYKIAKTSNNPKVLLTLTAQQYSEKGAAYIEKMVGSVIGPQSDTSMFWKIFGHTAKMSNLFVRQLSEIVNHLHNSVVNDNIESKKYFIDALTPYRKKISEFLKDGYIMSGVNYAQIEKDKREYELDKLKIVYPEVYGEMLLEDYIKSHQQYGIPELQNRNDEYYQYKYEYDNGLETVKWETSKRKKYTKEGLDKIKEVIGEEGNVWENLFYQRKVDTSYDRKNSGSKTYLKQQRAETSPYNDIGELREGYKAITYRQAKDENLYSIKDRKNIISTNPRFELFSEDDNTDNDGDIVFYLDPKGSKDAKLSFQYLKWNNMNLGAKKTEDEVNSEKETIKENFSKEYKSFIQKLKSSNLTEVQYKRDLKNWVNRSLMFEPTAEYWDKNQENIGIDFKNFYKSVSPNSNDYAQMLDRESEYKELSLRKQMILKKYKNQNDYKEVDVQEITQSDKSLMEEIEDKMRDVMYKNKEGVVEGTELLSIANLFKARDIEIYGTSGDATLRMNTAFREYFKEQIGVDFEDANLKQYKKFFDNNANFNVERNAKRLSNLKTDLANKKESSLVVDYRDRARELEMDESDNDNVIKAFYIQNSPSWYKRYDANESYDSFLKDYSNDVFSVEKLIEDYLESDSNQIVYKDKPLDLMQITPSFRFATPVEENIDELYEQYLQPGLTDIQKDDILQKMGAVQDVDQSYKEDRSHIRNNPEDLKAYILMMDLRLNILKKDDMMKPQYVYLLPQQRISSYERFESLIKDGEKKKQIVDYIYEALSFRPDDYEENYKMSKIPKYGYFKLKPEEMTTDVFHALVWGMGNANLYQNRVKYFSDAAKMLDGLAGQDFKNGKKATDTNYYKIAKEMMDFNIYGKTVSKKMEFEVPFKDKDGNNRRFDISKLLFGLKGFGVTMALGLSPIVAITNFISGGVQASINHMVGRKLYKQANKRSIGMLAKMYPATLKDVGEFSPEAKINKIMYQFGLHDVIERYQNAKYNKVLRLLPQTLFSMMAITNFPLEAQSTLTKLMEYRLVNGVFLSWREFSFNEKVLNPKLTEKEISAKFNELSKQSMYDFLDDNGEFDLEKLEQAGYTGDPKKSKLIVMQAIRDIAEQTTMEIASYNEGEGGRNPLASFVLTLKKWMVMSTSTMFGNRRYAQDGEEEGLIYTPGYIFKIFESAIKDKESFRQAYDNLDEVERMNVKTSAAIGAMLTSLLVIAYMLKGMADDDENKDNYMVQLAAYMAMRGLNEAASGNVMLPEAYYEAIQNPIMIGSTLKNLTAIVNPNNIGETVASGKYESLSKMSASIIKATYMKNIYSVSNGNIIGQTRQSYEHFNNSESLYHIFSLMPETDKK